MNDYQIIIFFVSVLFLNIMVKYLKGVLKEKRPNNKCYGMPSSKSTVLTFILIYLINIHKYKNKTVMKKLI